MNPPILIPSATRLNPGFGKIISTCVASALLLAGGPLFAANVTKLDTTSMANTVANWSAAPATTDIGEFGATPASGTLAALTLGGANLTLGGLQFDGTMNGPATILAGNTLTIGTAGANCINASAANQSIAINCGLTLVVSANTWNVASGQTLTVGGALTVGAGNVITFAGGGNYDIGGYNSGNGTGGAFITTSGTFSSRGALTIQKTGSSTTTLPTATVPVSPATSQGFYVNGGNSVFLNALALSTGNGGCQSRIDNGNVIITNTLLIGQSSHGSRGSYFQVGGNSAKLTVLDTGTGVLMSPNNGTTVNLSELYLVNGATATLGKITFGAASDTVAGNAFVIVSNANLYIGSGGIVKANTAGLNAVVSLLNAATLGASNNWSSSQAMVLGIGQENIKAADANGGAHNITLSGVLSGAGGITTTGGGTLTLSGANTFTGVITNNAGIMNAGIAESANVSGPFGKQLANAAGTITFGGGTLQYSGVNNFDYSGRFNTVAQPVSIDTAGQTVTFATAMMSGVAGTLTLTNSTGSGKLILSAANTYTGATTNNGGLLVINGSVAGDVVVNSGGQLGGNGTVSGVATINSGAGLAPGASVGTNTVGSLVLNSGSTNNFEFSSSPAANDQTIVSTASGLTVNGGAFNLYQSGSTAAWTVPGTYNLIQYTGTDPSLDGTWTTSSASNPHIANPQTGYAYSFAASGGWVSVTITANVNNGTWAVDNDGNWSVAGNWTAVSGTMPPSSPSDTATLGTGSSLRTVTLNANETVGTLNFNNVNSFTVANAGNTLTLDNSGSGAAVNVTGGTLNSIATAVSLNDNANMAVSSGKSLAVSSVISSTSASKTLAVSGAGTLALSGNNTYGPTAGTTGTTLSGGGTLQLGNNGALSTGDLNVTGSSTVQAGTALNLANNIAVSPGATATVDNNGNGVTLGGVVSGSGALTKIGNGSLTLSGANSYSGGTVINAGVASVSSDGATGGSAGNLGTVPASATANNVILNGGDLRASATMTLHANRGVGIGATTGSTGATALIDAASGQVLTVGGVIASAGNNGVNGLTVNGVGNNGTVILGAANTFGGSTIVSNGILQLANSSALASSTLNYDNQGGVLSFGSLTASTLGGLSGAQNLALSNNATAAVTLTVGANNANTVYSGNLSGPGALTKSGAGKLTLSGVNSYTGNTVANSGTLEITNGGVINGGTLTGQGFLVDGGSVTSTGASQFNSVNNAFSQSSGTVSLGTINQTTAAGDGQLISVTGGSFTATSLSFQRTASFTTAPTATTPITAATGSGLYVNGASANVNLGTLSIGLNNSGASARVDNGTVSVSGQVLVGRITGGRWNILQINGGSFTSSDTVNGIVINQNNGEADKAELYLSGGITTAERIAFGQPADTFNNTGWLIMNNAAQLYVGSGGIVHGHVGDTANISLLGGTLGAKADWASSLNMQLSGTSFTIQAADAANVPHNIALSGALSGAGALVKTGGGTLTLTGTETYSGTTTVSAGTLNGTATLGSDTTVNSGGTLQPGLGGLDTSTLTINNNLTLSGNALLALNRTSGQNASKVAGISTVTYGGTLTVTNVGDPLQSGDTFTLFSATTYAGNFAATNLPALDSGLKWVWDPAVGQLSVSASVNTVSTNITTSVSGSTLTLSWPTDHTGWRLQVQTNDLATGLSGTWTDVSGAAATNLVNQIINPANGSVFYRLVYP